MHVVPWRPHTAPTLSPPSLRPVSERFPSSLIEHLSVRLDPRIERTKRHKLLDILTLAVCAVLGGADHWSEIAEFGEAKRDGFARFLELPHGIPSPDPFARLFARLDPAAFETAFTGRPQGDQRHGQRRGGNRGPRACAARPAPGAAHCTGSARRASANRLVLGQVRTDAKSNEISAIPQRLRLLELEGCIVTLDAMGCQKDIAGLIRERGGPSSAGAQGQPQQPAPRGRGPVGDLPGQRLRQPRLQLSMSRKPF